MLYQVFGSVFHLDYFGEGMGLALTVAPLLAQGAGFPWCFLFVMGQWFVALSVFRLLARVTGPWTNHYTSLVLVNEYFLT